MAANQQRIIMNHTTAPSAEDIEALAAAFAQNLPDEFESVCKDLSIAIEEWADESMTDSGDDADPYDLLALYRSGKEITPGVERKTTDSGDTLVLFRRPLLDMWSETGEDLAGLVRQVMVEEIGRFHAFSDDDIDDIARRHTPSAT